MKTGYRLRAIGYRQGVLGLIMRLTRAISFTSFRMTKYFFNRFIDPALRSGWGISCFINRFLP
jgi:hypothetical protein